MKVKNKIIGFGFVYDYNAFLILIFAGASATAAYLALSAYGLLKHL